MIYICGRAFFRLREEILFGAARIGGFFAEKHNGSKERKKERLQPRPPRYVVKLFTYALSYFILEDPLTVLGVYFADWCGQKGPQMAVLKLNLCLFGMFFILLMSLIPFENKFDTCTSSDWMAEITPCFYSNLILNHSPILSQWIKIMKCGLSAYPPLSPLLCFSWIIFFLLCFCIHISSLSPLVSWATETMMI